MIFAQSGTDGFASWPRLVFEEFLVANWAIVFLSFAFSARTLVIVSSARGRA